jgi:hypothetical protein
MKHLNRFIASLIAFSVSLASLVFSQTSSTSLRGTVTDPSGGVVQGATVVLENKESNLSRTVTTGVQGDYQFPFLPPGTYSLLVTASGFERYQQSGLQLPVNTPVTANVGLKLGKASEVVNVSPHPKHGGRLAGKFLRPKPGPADPA